MRVGWLQMYVKRSVLPKGSWWAVADVPKARSRQAGHGARRQPLEPINCRREARR